MLFFYNKTAKKECKLCFYFMLITYWIDIVNVCSVQLLSHCPALWDPTDYRMPGFSVHHQLLELAQTHVHEVADAINHLILCRPLLPPSIFRSIRVFSSESVLLIRWPKYWSFSFSISPSNEYSGLISLRID